MKPTIKRVLKEAPDNHTIYVDDVDVSKGVYARENATGLLSFVGTRFGLYHIAHNFDLEVIDAGYKSFKELVNYETEITFYTIPDNRKIVTEKVESGDWVLVEDCDLRLCYAIVRDEHGRRMEKPIYRDDIRWYIDQGNKVYQHIEP